MLVVPKSIPSDFTARSQFRGLKPSDGYVNTKQNGNRSVYFSLPPLRSNEPCRLQVGLWNSVE